MISRADQVGGRLIVSGETARPNTRVSLDGRFTTQSDSNGRFAFRLSYMPDDCTVQVRAAGQRRRIQIDECHTIGVLSPPGTPLIDERDGEPPDAVFRTPRIVDPTMGNPGDAFDVPENLVVPRD